MAKILIGVPSSRYYQPFMESLPRFISEVSKEHTISVCFIRDRKIDEARNDIVDFFLKTDFEYLLFLDDDHSGHTKEMLDVLLKQNTYFASILSYTRYFPFVGNLLFYSGYKEPDIKYAEIKFKDGIRECDLAGFGMGLIRRDTFEKIEKPYFVCDVENAHEDNYFCDRLIEKGIHPIGVWDYVLPHNGIGKENINEEYQKVFKSFCSTPKDVRIEKKFNNNTQKEEMVMHF